MFHTVVFVISFLAAVNRVFLSETHSQSWTRCERHIGWRIHITDTTEVAATELACIFRCFHSPNCIAVDYVASTQTCSFSSSNTLTVIRADDSHTAIIIRRNIDVFLFASEQIRRMYTHSNAREICTSLGGRLMTLNELTALYDNGYEKCSCGWVLEGGIYYPMQRIRSGCGSFKGIIECSGSKASAWCTVQ